MTEEIDGLEIKRYWLYASNSKKAFPRILNMISYSLTVFFSLLYLLKRKNDLIIVESPPLTLAESGLILGKLTRTKVIMNVADLWPLTARELGAISGDGLLYKVAEKLEKHCYKHAELCLGQSQEIVDYVNDHGAKEVYLFRNGVDPSRFLIQDNKPFKREGQPLRIMYAGLLGYAQGIADIIKNVNFKQCGAEFHIYGAGGEKEAVERYIAENPNCGVFFHGKVTREEVPSILAMADCTLIPLVINIFGAVPSKIYESMAAGLPILFSGEGEGKRIIEENNLGWVSAAKDFEQLSHNIRICASSKEDWMIKKQNCIDCAKNKYNRPKQIESLYVFLESKFE